MLSIFSVLTVVNFIFFSPISVDFETGLRKDTVFLLLFSKIVFVVEHLQRNSGIEYIKFFKDLFSLRNFLFFLINSTTIGSDNMN